MFLARFTLGNREEPLIFVTGVEVTTEKKLMKGKQGGRTLSSAQGLGALCSFLFPLCLSLSLTLSGCLFPLSLCGTLNRAYGERRLLLYRACGTSSAMDSGSISPF